MYILITMDNVFRVLVVICKLFINLHKPILGLYNDFLQNDFRLNRLYSYCGATTVQMFILLVLIFIAIKNICIILLDFVFYLMNI